MLSYIQAARLLEIRAAIRLLVVPTLHMNVDTKYVAASPKGGVTEILVAEMALKLSWDYPHEKGEMLLSLDASISEIANLFVETLPPSVRKCPSNS